MMPALPKVEIIINPMEEQLAQKLVIIVKNELDISDLSNLIFEFLKR
jgi:hypothetical protein